MKLTNNPATRCGNPIGATTRRMLCAYEIVRWDGSSGSGGVRDRYSIVTQPGFIKYAFSITERRTLLTKGYVNAAMTKITKEEARRIMAGGKPSLIDGEKVRAATTKGHYMDQEFSRGTAPLAPTLPIITDQATAYSIGTTNPDAATAAAWYGDRFRLAQKATSTGQPAPALTPAPGPITAASAAAAAMASRTAWPPKKSAQTPAEARAEMGFPGGTATTALEALDEIVAGTPKDSKVMSIDFMRQQTSADATAKGHAMAPWNDHGDWSGTNCTKCGVALVVGTPAKGTKQQIWGAACTVSCHAWLARTQGGHAVMYQQQIAEPAAAVADEQPSLADIVGAAVTAALAAAGRSS